MTRSFATIPTQVAPVCDNGLVRKRERTDSEEESKMTKTNEGVATTETTIAEPTPKEFRCAFQVTRTIIFEVCYHTLGRNDKPYFSTQANRLNTRRTDYTECGQAQDRLLPKGSVARRFWEKWDGKHLATLTDEERDEVWADIATLKTRYNYLIHASDKFGTEDTRDIRFSDVVALSKEPLPSRPRRKSA